MQEYTCSTRLLDYENSAIEVLIVQQGWRELPVGERIEAVRRYIIENVVFTFCGGGIRPVSTVLVSRGGNSMERCAAAMALLRAVGISCRLRAYLVDEEALYHLLGDSSGHQGQSVLLGVTEAFGETAWNHLEGLSLDSLLMGKRGFVKLADISGHELGVFTCPEDALARYRKAYSWGQRIRLRLLLSRLERSLKVLRERSDQVVSE